MTAAEFKAKKTEDLPEKGRFKWEAPSNIALVKYWGKKGEQLPTNPSVSFTLNASATRTELTYQKCSEPWKTPDFEILLDGLAAPDFKPKISAFFNRILPYMPFLQEYRFEISTANTFPHSSGIASSASGMAALALCLMDLEREIYPETDGDYFHTKASFIARLGSGSASRSILGPLVLWGSHPSLSGSSDLYGIRYPLEVHPVFESYQDTILLVDKGRKTVSSSVGHGLMKGHPFASQRFSQAGRHLEELLPIFKSGDLEKFMSVVESEALSLHAMMMSSMPYFLLMKPGTLEIIERIWSFRKESGHPLCFTLDAGANVHVLYPESAAGPVYSFIREALLPFCEGGQHICDQVGKGSRKL
ncbi:diphosphomevalonate/mevalonate 3,5-bisphosphate decarboxylase family protein [Robiginitalea sp. IMCC44478]|uniref:diphosphomevalonate/mevalonate 3,5-bisphosphate decarboxylase family protein n=1 Tax=Robiginitalea sp. IMCC44478 TaxID=3459122 RepID=UPI0040412E53